jgi:hypothetical protein
VEIQPDGEHPLRYFLKDHEDNWVFWDQAPGAEPIGEPKAEAKWKMLMDQVDAKGPLDAKAPDYLQPTRKGVEFVKGRLAPEKAKGKL